MPSGRHHADDNRRWALTEVVGVIDDGAVTPGGHAETILVRRSAGTGRRSAPGVSARCIAMQEESPLVIGPGGADKGVAPSTR